MYNKSYSAWLHNVNTLLDKEDSLFYGHMLNTAAVFLLYAVFTIYRLYCSEAHFLSIGCLERSCFVDDDNTVLYEKREPLIKTRIKIDTHRADGDILFTLWTFLFTIF
jgi:hypothetical protein